MPPPPLKPVDNKSHDYLVMEIERAHLTRNKQTLGLGKMDPFVTLSLDDNATILTKTPTHWDAHKEPVWFHECPKISTQKPQVMCTFVVHNDSSLGVMNRNTIGQCQISIEEIIQRAQNSKSGSLGMTTSKIKLSLANNEGFLILNVKVEDTESWRESQTKLLQQDGVDSTWFQSPVQRLGVSGGTAPFFALRLTPKGQQNTNHTETNSYYIGKDLSHAQDEQEFYDNLRTIKTKQLEPKGVGLMAPFMFDYLGVLPTTTTENEEVLLLVMQNLRNDYKHFRMLDLKMGQQTAHAGWQGKSRWRAMKQNVLDGMTNSLAEGYRLEGFDGNPLRVESMDPLMDLLLAKQPVEAPLDTMESTDDTQDEFKTLFWGRQVTEKQIKKAKRIMLQTLTGAEIFRYFIDVHLEPNAHDDFEYYLLPVEIAEIVLHELVSRLVQLATTCHKVEVPQKWIGSSVALGYDAGLFPNRTEEAEQQVRSKVIVNVFDWGRSELLTAKNYQLLSEVEKEDRNRFWDYYKNGMDRLAFNACREYYHHFTNTTAWKIVTLQVMDFDSMSMDDYIGKVTIHLPDPSDTKALAELQQSKEYTLLNERNAERGTIFCSISWLPLPEGSRVIGIWRVHVERACNLPIMDRGISNLSDPYVTVIAHDEGNLRELTQMTCVKARTLNPSWREILDLPILKEDLLKTAMEAKGGMFDDSFPPAGRELANVFRYPVLGHDDITYWTECLKRAAGM